MNESLDQPGLPVIEKLMEIGQRTYADTEGTYAAPAHGWTCFHCGETFTDPQAAAIHFGDDIDHRPGCIEKLNAPDKNLVLALRKVCDEFHRLQHQVSEEITNDVYYYGRLRSDLASIKPFAKCISLHDVFNLFDSLEGRALAAEERATHLRDSWDAESAERE